ncbi:MAG: hypothetical protein H7A45_02535 [Verrucomicrobiales bacterium]|nr:hypothetical protein [Verrucomicrobiales bacterium]MCP5526458.1 hypothetical protein [Verrucomicrobiales bacterium]
MTRRSLNLRPASLLLAGFLFLSIGYVGVLRPASQRSIELDRVLTNLWHSVVVSNATFAACAGVNPENFSDRLKALNRTQDEVGEARKLIDARVALPEEVAGRLKAPFQLLDFQSERQVLAEQLAAEAKAAGVGFQPAATNGLPQYLAETSNPALLWPRLFLSGELLRTAIACRVGEVRMLQQLPASDLVADAEVAGYIELPVQVEIAGQLEGVLRLLSCIPLRGTEFGEVDLAVTLTNKPALFLSRILARKASAERPTEVRLEAVVSGFVPLPPPIGGDSG